MLELTLFLNSGKEDWLSVSETFRLYLIFKWARFILCPYSWKIAYIILNYERKFFFFLILCFCFNSFLKAISMKSNLWNNLFEIGFKVLWKLNVFNTGEKKM